MITMWCKACKGRVFIDRVFTTETRFELFCIACGNRWMLRKDRNAFTKWLAKIEKDLERMKNGTTSS